MSNTPKAGRRERLLARKRPSAVYQLAVVDDADAAAELAAAKEALDVARFRDDADAGRAVVDADKRLDKARKAVQACYEPVTLRALPPVEFEALIAKPENQPRDGKDERWNEDVFPLACFLATVEAGDLSVEEWSDFVTTSLSQGEATALYAVAIGVNARWPSGAVPNA